MELPFAVELPGDDGIENHAGRNNSLQHSESSSLVTASSQGSFMNASNNHLNDPHCSPLLPNTPQDIVIPSHHHHHPQHRKEQQQGQLVLTPASQSRINSTKDAVYGEPENDFTYVNFIETNADEDDMLMEGVDVVPQDQAKGDVLAVILSGMQQSGSGSLLVRETEN